MATKKTDDTTNHGKHPNVIPALPPDVIAVQRSAEMVELGAVQVENQARLLEMEVIAAEGGPLPLLEIVEVEAQIIALKRELIEFTERLEVQISRLQEEIVIIAESKKDNE